MRELMQRVVALDCYGRDKNGINGLIRNINTALIATTEIGLKRTSVIALLLYRPVLKKAITMEEVEKTFDADVTLIIHRLLKTSDLYARNTAVNSENFHHLLFSFAEDVRVILIMIADRLCLMRLGKQLKEDDRLRLATEASYLYAPLAHRLGLYKIKSELEDLSLKYTDRKQYDFIKRKLNETKRSRDLYIAQFIAPIEKKLKEAGLHFDIKGRTKSIHSINNKLKKQKIEFEGIYDLFAIRVVLDTPLEKERSECWQVYSIITDMYQPNPNRMKDWISIPKTNGYESLHITVMGPQNKWVEVQIRTRRMDEIAERGLAAHWKYKGVKAESGLDEFLNTVRAALEEKEKNPMDLMQDFKMDLYKDEIYVFTPTGELIKLAKGATVLDFAFAIHSKLGSKCVSAKVNEKNVPIKYVLHNGDTVSIVTSPSQSPKRDWLNIVKSTQAKNKINQWFRSQFKEENIAKGKELISQYCKMKSIELSDINKPEYQNKILRKYGFHDWDSALATVGHGGLKESQVVNRMLEEYKKDHVVPITDSDVLENIQDANISKTIPQKSKSGIVVKGLYDVAVHFSKCCSPVPGDEIVGFVTRGRGVSIHRTDCINIINLSDMDRARLIDAEWQQGASEGSNGLYLAEIKIFGNNRTGLLVDITKIFTERGIDINAINSKTSKQGVATISVSFNTKGKMELQSLVDKIRQVESVIDIERTTG